MTLWSSRFCCYFENYVVFLKVHSCDGDRCAIYTQLLPTNKKMSSLFLRYKWAFLCRSFGLSWFLYLISLTGNLLQFKFLWCLLFCENRLSSLLFLSTNIFLFIRILSRYTNSKFSKFCFISALIFREVTLAFQQDAIRHPAYWNAMGSFYF